MFLCASPALDCCKVPGTSLCNNPWNPKNHQADPPAHNNRGDVKKVVPLLLQSPPAHSFYFTWVMMLFEGSLDNSAEIIWHCNPLFCKLDTSTAKMIGLWSAFEKQSHKLPHSSFPPFQPLPCCHFSVLCIAFLRNLFKVFFSPFLTSWNKSTAKNCQQS